MKTKYKQGKEIVKDFINRHTIVFNILTGIQLAMGRYKLTY